MTHMPIKALLITTIFTLVGCAQLQEPQQSLQPAQVSKPENTLDLAQADKLCLTTPEAIESFEASDHDDLWDRLRAGFSLEETHHPRIDKHRAWYAKHQRYMNRVTERAKRYMYHIAGELEARNLPLELALLPIVESAYDPFAYSHGRASGMWQFIPGTGRMYGLKQNWWYDGRRDVVASTDAALRYLSYLNRRFKGDWMLALAAYNTGEGNVSKAIRRNKRSGKPTDFWSLKLPRETRAYVPQLLALAELVKTPEQYNLSLIPIPNQPYFAEVDIKSQIDLAQAANLADIDIDDLYLLNAGYNRWATDPKGPHRLLLPVAKADAFADKLNKLSSQERIAWERYRVKSGDSLLKISKHFNTTVASLKDANNLRSNMIRQNQMLLIPVAAKPAKHYAYSETQRIERKQQYSRGRSGTAKTTYRVKAGDSFWKIAKAYQVKVSDLAKWNAMAPKDPLKQGQKLVIWAKNDRINMVRSNHRQGNQVIRKVAYQVRNGDSLARIAGKFNLSVNDILKWNPIKKNNYIHPGQSLTLFVDVTRTN